MRALSLHQPFASLVGAGLKTIETRKTRLKYRGDVVICSTKYFGSESRAAFVQVWNGARQRDVAGVTDFLAGIDVGHSADDLDAERIAKIARRLPLGVTVCVAELVDCRALVEGDWPRSLFFAPGRFAWALENIRPLKPTPVRGMQGLWPIADALVEFAEAP